MMPSCTYYCHAASCCNVLCAGLLIGCSGYGSSCWCCPWSSHDTWRDPIGNRSRNPRSWDPRCVLVWPDGCHAAVRNMARHLAA